MECRRFKTLVSFIVFCRKGAFRETGFVLLLSASLLWPAGCQLAPPVRDDLPLADLADGRYEGSYHAGPNAATVAVTLSAGRITSVQVLRHFSSWKGREPERVIPGRIIAAQSVGVDGVSGATNSSRVIMNAVRRALEKAAAVPR